VPAASGRPRSRVENAFIDILFVSCGPNRQFVDALGHIFSKYCTPTAALVARGLLMKPPANAYLTSTGLDQFAIDTNGKALDAEAKAELRDMLDVNAQENLT
jgi:hypothetical protein